MNDFREAFDLRKLSEHDIGMIAYVLNSPAYQRIFEPYLTSVRESMAHKMLDRSVDRKAMYPDDFLAGGIVAIDGLLEFFKLLIEETNMETIHQAQSGASADVEYHRRAQAGRLVPVLGMNQEPLPAVAPSPEEDF